MGSGPQPASSACISLSYLVKCCVEGVLGGHTPGPSPPKLVSHAVHHGGVRPDPPPGGRGRITSARGSTRDPAVPVRADSAAALGSLLPQLSIGLRLTHRFLVLDLSDQLALRLRERAVEVPVGGDSHHRRVAG
jgi:hypothetical protein